MFGKSGIQVVPAYWATLPGGQSVPFIVSLLFYDAQGRPRIPPAVERSIDRTVEIAGREVLGQAIIADDDDLSRAEHLLQRAAKAGAIALFRCQSPETAERLMQHLHATCSLRLVQKDVDSVT